MPMCWENLQNKDGPVYIMMTSYAAFVKNEINISFGRISMGIGMIMWTWRDVWKNTDQVMKMGKLEGEWKFPGGAVVRTQHFAAKGMSSIPAGETKIPQSQVAYASEGPALRKVLDLL